MMSCSHSPAAKSYRSNVEEEGDRLLLTQSWELIANRILITQHCKPIIAKIQALSVQPYWLSEASRPDDPRTKLAEKYAPRIAGTHLLISVDCEVQRVPFVGLQPRNAFLRPCRQSSIFPVNNKLVADMDC